MRTRDFAARPDDERKLATGKRAGVFGALLWISLSLVASVRPAAGQATAPILPDNDPILLEAVYGNAKAINAALDRGLSVNACDQIGQTLVLKALLAGHVDLARDLVRRGFDPTLTYKSAARGEYTEIGLSPLAVAVAVGAEDIVDALLAKGIRAYPKFTAEDYGLAKTSPVQAAIANDRADLLKKLLSNLEPELARQKMDIYAGATLHACRSIAVLDLLVEYGAEINATFHTFPFNGALHTYASQGWLEGVARALELGADPTAENRKRQLPEDVAKTREIKLLLQRAAVKIRVDRGLQVSGAEQGLGNSGDTIKVFAIDVLDAAFAGSEDTALKLLAEHASKDLEARDDRGWTLLNYALKYRYLKLATALVDRGADVKALTDSGSPVIGFAAETGDLALVTKIAARRVDVNAADAGPTALLIAVQNDDLPMVDLLLKLGAKPEPPLPRDLTGIHQNALMLAAQVGNIEMLDRLLAAGGDIDSVDSSGENIVFYAARSGKVEVLQWALDHKAYLQLKNPYGNNALVTAARLGKYEMVKALVAAGLRHPDARKHANSSNSQKTIDFLTEMERSEAPDDPAQLWNRIDAPSLDELKQYLAHGGDVNFASGCPTPLQVMAGEGNVVAVELLLNKGADPAKRGNLFNSPVFHAIARCTGDIEARRMLSIFLAHGISPDAQEFVFGMVPPEKIASGATLLMVVTDMGYMECVRFLLKNGADPSKRSAFSGTNAFDVLKATNRLYEDQRFDLQKLMEAHLRKRPPAPPKPPATH